MKLFHAPSSPYVRKVLIFAHEAGLADRVEIATVSTSPLARNADLAASNPLGKIPTLVTEDGLALFDSRVICEYLDDRAGAGLIPPSGEARWRALRLQALADGIADATVLARYETSIRPEPARFPAWLEGQFVKVEAGIAALEEEEGAGALSAGIGIGAIAAGAALGYLDLRFAERDWRAGAPALAAWYEAFAARPSMRATAPPEA